MPECCRAADGDAIQSYRLYLAYKVHTIGLKFLGEEPDFLRDALAEIQRRPDVLKAIGAVSEAKRRKILLK